MRFFVTFLSLTLLAGCCFNDRHWISDPGKDEFLRVVSGDRFYFSLEEAVGCRWSMTCDDPDVEVRLDHELGPADVAGALGKANVEIHIHRGYDGPSVVQFVYRRSGGRKPLKKFKIGLFKRTGDVAFWE